MTAATDQMTVSDEAKAAGEEAMRIAKLNHPDVDWQADPLTGAPLVPGTAESAETQYYDPPLPDHGQGWLETDLDGGGPAAPRTEAKAAQIEAEEAHAKEVAKAEKAHTTEAKPESKSK